MHALWTTTKSGIHPTFLRSGVLIVLLVLLSYNNAAQTTTRLGRRIDTAAVVAANRGGGGVPSRNAATAVASMSKSNSKSVVVIGATGFVGSHLVRNLLHKGYRVEGTCRSISSAHWLWDIAPNAKENLHLHEFTLATDTTVEAAMAEFIPEDCEGIFLCAGYEQQAPSTIEFMVNAALTVLKAAELAGKKKNTHNNIPCVVLTSSTGSTNLPGAHAEAVKNEIEYWSDPAAQQAHHKWSPAAKTLMELRALEYVGRDARNDIVDPIRAQEKPRLCILNPSLILGPQLQPGTIRGNGLPWFGKIVRGQIMAETLWNDSMSIIHADDLAKLHIGCLETPSASGRYFGVEQSWHWEEICHAIQNSEGEAHFKMPSKNYTDRAPVTLFDTSRRDTLMAGFQLRGLTTLVSETCDFLRDKTI